MKPISEMSQAEIGAFIQSQLRRDGIDVVLSGGASVAIFSEGKYVSKDLDMVPEFFLNRRRLSDTMMKMGFEEPKSRYFIHPDSEHIVEFPPGPLSVGSEPVKEIIEIEYVTGILRVISATECVKDRLAAFYHWDDKQSLIQAVLVALRSNVDLDEIKRWSLVECFAEKFDEFRTQLMKGA
ncbi:MAG: hypothetical protein IIC78_14980 [Chloroflexi bacterium]|nr:hypothetical protein [Chloroflexota bacterium]